MSDWLGHRSANTSGCTPRGGSSCEDLCSKDSSKAAGCIGARYITASCSPRVTQCAIASRSWKEDALSQLFKKEERKLYSANQLLTLNYSLSSMAQSLLPQFSVLHMKHKISSLSSKPFLIEIGERAEVRIGPYEVASFGKEYIILQFYFFKILFYSSWIERETCQWPKGGWEWPCSFSDMGGPT